MSTILPRNCETLYLYLEHAITMVLVIILIINTYFSLQECRKDESELQNKLYILNHKNQDFELQNNHCEFTQHAHTNSYDYFVFKTRFSTLAFRNLRLVESWYQN